MSAPRAVVLLSGGLDSATAMAMAKAEGRELYALSAAYGQRHTFELDAARRVAAALDAVDHRIVEMDLGAFGGSSLTGEGEIPHGRDGASIGAGIPTTYVPARTTILLSFALAWAEVLEAGEIVIGVNAVDYSGYPDCRPAYVEAFQRLADLATRAGVEGRGPRIRAPLLHLSKAEIIVRGSDLGVDYRMTHSCYDPAADGAACGTCDACRLRRDGFRNAGVPDPTRYA
jgi:7-cyano-7-deazaguanine synthase